MKKATIAYIPSSHLDLFWLGNYKTCLERGASLIKDYLDRCLETPDETFLLETVVFGEYFLQKYPEYRANFLKLAAQGRLEVGSAFVDRWETLVPGESLIRNVMIGKRWCRQVLGIDNHLITHPDLPSLTSQIPQIYTQLGVKYYVTSRKVYRHGRIWRFRAPEGSRIIMLNWPRHYVFPLMSADDVTPEVLKSIWVPPLDVDETLKGFPLGVVAASGSAGDLAGRETFRERYRQNLEDYVATFRLKYPDFDFAYAIPSAVLQPYDDYAGLAEHSGEVPSVWGVAADEIIEFFTRDRQLERQLLAAEKLASAASLLGLDWRPPSADRWQGTYSEDAFFARRDPIASGREFDELWRMHIFAQDHNGGGQEGALSSFQKRVIQERALAYTREIIDFSLEKIGANLSGSVQRLLVFNPHAQPWQGTLPVAIPLDQVQAGGPWVDDAGNALLTQVEEQSNGQSVVQVLLPEIPAFGYQTFAARPAGPTPDVEPASASYSSGLLQLCSAWLEVDVDLHTGSLTHLLDRKRGQNWGAAQLGRLYSIEESGNDVTLRIRPDADVAHESLKVIEVIASGPLFTRVRIQKQLLKCSVEQILTLWNHEARLDLDTYLYWWGKKNQQVRLGLSGSIQREKITYGVPFYGAGWTETVEGSGPWNSDEISLEFQMSYREAHDWLYLQGRSGGLMICTDRPGLHHGPDGLEAVLLRTSPSCGDGRLFFDNAGEHNFHFSFVPGDAGWKSTNAQQAAARLLKQPLYRLVEPGQTSGTGSLPDVMSLLQVQDERFALSCIYPGAQPGTLIARVWETTGQTGVAHFSGPLAQGQAVAVDFMEAGEQALKGGPGGWGLEIPAWGIRTVKFTR